MCHRLLLSLPAALFLIAAIPQGTKDSPRELTTSDPAIAVPDQMFRPASPEQTTFPPEPPAPPQQASPLPTPTTKWEHGVAQDGPSVVSELKETVDAALFERGSAIPSDLLNALVLTESMGDPKAKNGSGARGLLGITPRVCKELKRKTCNLLDPTSKLSGGIGYLERLRNTYGFEGDEVILAFGVGPNKARHILKKSEPEEHPYVRKVNFAREYARSFIDPPL